MSTAPVTESRQRQRHDNVLVEPSWLTDHLHDPGLCLVEVDVSPVSFEEWHIDGAVLWDVYGDLKDEGYRLVDRAAVQRLFERSGIGPQSTVVLYGYAPAMGFWLLKLYGHADVRILDCDRGAWRQEGRPLTTDTKAPVTTSYPLGDEDDGVRARRVDVEQAIGNPASTLIDVRSEPEFRGERFWPSGGMEPGGRAGHVPTALHVSIEGIHDAAGSFLGGADLQQIFSAVDPSGSGQLITYCTIGGRASTAWFALTYLLGRKNVRVYDGSWAEWGRTPTAPICLFVGRARRTHSGAP